MFPHILHLLQIYASPWSRSFCLKPAINSPNFWHQFLIILTDQNFYIFKLSPIWNRHCEGFFPAHARLIKLNDSITTDSDQLQKAHAILKIISINCLTNVSLNCLQWGEGAEIHWCDDKTSVFPTVRNKPQSIVLTSFAEFGWPHPS